MTDSHPITPPTKLIAQWVKAAPGPFQEEYIAVQAARWGSDQELEACCADVQTRLGPNEAVWLRAVRRPWPLSLKEQALAELDLLREDAKAHGLGFDAPAIRRALEQLPD